MTSFTWCHFLPVATASFPGVTSLRLLTSGLSDSLFQERRLQLEFVKLSHGWTGTWSQRPRKRSWLFYRTSTSCPAPGPPGRAPCGGVSLVPSPRRKPQLSRSPNCPLARGCPCSHRKGHFLTLLLPSPPSSRAPSGFSSAVRRGRTRDSSAPKVAHSAPSREPTLASGLRPFLLTPPGPRAVASLHRKTQVPCRLQALPLPPDPLVTQLYCHHWGRPGSGGTALHAEGVLGEAEGYSQPVRGRDDDRAGPPGRAIPSQLHGLSACGPSAWAGPRPVSGHAPSIPPPSFPPFLILRPGPPRASPPGWMLLLPLPRLPTPAGLI